jgi:hypothetical protein
VFGVASEEYLNYAQNNRREWESRGKERVEEMMAKYVKKQLDEQTTMDTISEAT